MIHFIFDYIDSPSQYFSISIEDSEFDSGKIDWFEGDAFLMNVG